jgi:hypothetical protein
MAVKVSEGYLTASFFGGRVEVKRVCFTYKTGNLIAEYTVIHYVERKEKMKRGALVAPGRRVTTTRKII